VRTVTLPADLRQRINRVVHEVKEHLQQKIWIAPYPGKVSSRSTVNFDLVAHQVQFAAIGLHW